MAITRLWQAGAETNSLEEFSFIFQYAGTVSVQSGGNTGTYKFRTAKQTGYCYTVQLLNEPGLRQIRHGCFMYTWCDSTGGRQISIMSGGTYLAELRWASTTGALQLYVNGTLRDSGTGIISPTTWTHIGIDLKVHDTSGWVYVYVDGVETLSWTGNTGNSDINRMQWGLDADSGSSSNYSDFDDMYIDDTTGEAVAAPVPIRKFYYVTPNGNGNYSQWDGSDGNSTDNYLLVDEIPPSTSDYLETTVTDELDSFTMTSFTLGANETPIAVIPFVYAKRENISEELALGTRYSSTDVVGSGFITGLSYNFHFDYQDTKPGGGSWDQTSIDGFETVIKSKGTY